MAAASHSAAFFKLPTSCCAPAPLPQGERDYALLRGDTGPLVYPAGFVYLFSALRWVTNEAVLPAQVRRPARRRILSAGSGCGSALAPGRRAAGSGLQLLQGQAAVHWQGRRLGAGASGPGWWGASLVQGWRQGARLYRERQLARVANAQEAVPPSLWEASKPTAPSLTAFHLCSALPARLPLPCHPGARSFSRGSTWPPRPR